MATICCRGIFRRRSYSRTAVCLVAFSEVISKPKFIILICRLYLRSLSTRVPSKSQRIAFNFISKGNLKICFWAEMEEFVLYQSGGYRIRTCEGLRPQVFKTCAINHSANPPHSVQGSRPDRLP